MKTIIAGSRTIYDYPALLAGVKNFIHVGRWEITEIVSGTAAGVDRLGERYGRKMNIPSKQFPADWDKFGRKAGMIRNKEMADYADALIAIWDGESPGTQGMIKMANERGLVVTVLTMPSTLKRKLEERKEKKS